MLSKKSKKRGFTLIELMMVVFIVSIGIAGVLNLIAKIFLHSRFTSSKLTAIYLAQEGMEIVRNIRDTNWVEGEKWDQGIVSGDFEADWDDQSLSSYQGRYLRIDGGHYNYDSGQLTKFKRKITIEKESDRILVSVNVSWQEGGEGYFVEDYTELYDWQSSLEYNSGRVPIGIAMVDNPGVDDSCSGAECSTQGWKATDYSSSVKCRDADNWPELSSGIEEDFVCSLWKSTTESWFVFEISPDIGLNLPPEENDYYFSFHAFYDSGDTQLNEEVKVTINPGTLEEQSQTGADLWNGQGGAWKKCTFPEPFSLKQNDIVLFEEGSENSSVYPDWWQISTQHPGYQDCTIAHNP